MNNRPQKFGELRWLGLSLLVVIMDQISKAIIVAHLHVFETIRVLPVFNIVLLENKGAAFSFLANQPGWQRWLFTVLALVISAGIVGWLWRMPRNTNRWMAASLALIAGGAIGNVVDRVRLGYVIDFIQVHYHQWFYPAFNVADSAITVGAVMLGLSGFIMPDRSKSA